MGISWGRPLIFASLCVFNEILAQTLLTSFPKYDLMQN